MKRNNLFVIKFIWLTMIFFLSSSSSAIMKAMSTEELVKTSEIIVIGEVEDVKAQWSKDGKTIFTSASIVISDVIRGNIAQKKIIVEYEGGEVGDIGLRVSDVSPLSNGEKVILFLRSGKSKQEGVVHNIVGKAQGKYTIDNSGIARKSGFSIVSGEDVIDNNIPVDELIDKIRRVK